MEKTTHNYMLLKYSLFILLIVSVAVSGAQAQVNFTILHTNDEHSHLVPAPLAEYHDSLKHNALGGFARLATVVNRTRAEKEAKGEGLILLSGGDFMGGAAFGWLNLWGHSPELSLMQTLGYHAIAIGNHEFDFGPDVLANILQLAGYPDANENTALLSANLQFPNDHPLYGKGIQDFVILEPVKGLRIGVFGLIGKDAESKTAYTGNARFNDAVQVAENMVGKLRNQVDVIIALTHSGFQEDIELAQKVPGIDIIVGGHSHTLLEAPVFEGNTIIVQAGSNLSHVGVLEFAFHPDAGKLELKNTKNGTPYIIPLDYQIKADTAIAAQIAQYETTLNNGISRLTDGNVTSIRQTILQADFPLMAGPAHQETSLGNFLSDALRLETGQVLGRPVDIGVQANGAIRSHIKPGAAPWSKGEISFYDLVMSTGLGSGADGEPGFPVVAFYLTKAEVLRAMEISHLLSALMGNTYFLQFSGASMDYDPRWSTLGKIPFSGQPLPIYRAVQKARLYQTDQLQQAGAHTETLQPTDELLLIATDYFIASFLPMVGRHLPALDIQFKNELGNPIDLDEAIVFLNDSTQFKVWQAAVRHAMSFEPGHEGIAVLPAYYQTTGTRIHQVKYIPALVLWMGATVVVVLLLVAFFTRLWFKRRKRKHA